MNDPKAGSGIAVTRREWLRGAAALSVSPWLSRAEFLPPEDDPAARTRETFDFDWRFMRGDPAEAHLPGFADASCDQSDFGGQALRSERHGHQRLEYDVVTGSAKETCARPG